MALAAPALKLADVDTKLPVRTTSRSARVLVSFANPPVRAFSVPTVIVSDDNVEAYTSPDIKMVPSAPQLIASTFDISDTCNASSVSEVIPVSWL